MAQIFAMRCANRDGMEDLAAKATGASWGLEAQAKSVRVWQVGIAPKVIKGKGKACRTWARRSCGYEGGGPDREACRFCNVAWQYEGPAQGAGYASKNKLAEGTKVATLAGHAPPKGESDVSAGGGRGVGCRGPRGSKDATWCWLLGRFAAQDGPG